MPPSTSITSLLLSPGRLQAWAKPPSARLISAVASYLGACSAALFFHYSSHGNHCDVGVPAVASNLQPISRCCGTQCGPPWPRLPHLPHCPLFLPHWLPLHFSLSRPSMPVPGVFTPASFNALPAVYFLMNTCCNEQIQNSTVVNTVGMFFLI